MRVSFRDHRAELTLFGACVLEGLFPIIAHGASRAFSPLWFVGLSSLFAACVLGAYGACTGSFSRRATTAELRDCAWLALLIVTPTTLIFMGSALTSGINTGLLLQTEILTTFLIYGILFHERHTPTQIAGAMLVFSGTLAVLFNGSLRLNGGDALILVAVCIFPFGNFFAKRVLKTLPSAQVLLYRYFFSACILLPVAFAKDGVPDFTHSEANLWFFPAYVFLVMILSKLFWYGGLRHLSVSKAIGISSASPAFTLIFAALFLSEVPTIFQYAGLILSVTGVFTLIAGGRVTVAPDLV